MMVRAFIAVELPEDLRQAISRSTETLRKALPGPLVRWVAPQNIHLTLKFLGDVSPANLERLAEALGTEAAARETFTLSVGGLGAFPTPRRARLIWIGVEAPAALAALARGVEAAAARLGYAEEGRPFSPHLTLGRLDRSAGAADLARVHAALEAAAVGNLGAAPVEAVHIFKSDLRPGGSVYTRLYTLPLKSRPENTRGDS